MCDVDIVNNLPKVSKVAGYGVGTTGLVIADNEIVARMPKDSWVINESWKI